MSQDFVQNKVKSRPKFFCPKILCSKYFSPNFFVFNVEDNIKDVRNLFRLKNKKKKVIPSDTTVKGIRNLFRLKTENKGIKDRIIRYIRNVFEHEKKYYKPVRVSNFWSNN